MTDSSNDQDLADHLQSNVRTALETGQPLQLQAGNSKYFLGARSDAQTLDLAGHQGVISYEPTELVITARSGTTLMELNQLLASNNQHLPFEPPQYSPAATLGGTMACGVSGPARPFAGAVRDYVLGCRIINGEGQILQFGGQVMKNVAGYDVTRLMTGARGTLGVLLDISIKVLPVAETQVTLTQPAELAPALTAMQQSGNGKLPISAASFFEDTLYLRLSGSTAAVEAAIKRSSMQRAEDNSYWQQLRDHQLAFFKSELPLWRITVPPGTEAIDIAGAWLYDWAGTQRWLHSDADPKSLRAAVEAVNGFAQLYCAPAELQQTVGTEHPLSDKIMQLHRSIKASFDPQNIFNPGRLYPDV